MQEDLEVTGISRSGRVRKKSSKLMDFESPDDIDTRFRRTPVKPFPPFKQEDQSELHEASHRPQEAGTASGSDSDYYENNGEHAESMESDSSASEEGSARTPANSLYMMEKSSKKKLIVKDGKVIGRAKAQRKDKGKTRITAYMMWAKEARNELLRSHPDMDFSAISKRLGEMWANVNYNERYLWKRKAKRLTMQKEQSLHSGVSKIISNPDDADDDFAHDYFKKRRRHVEHNYCKKEIEIAEEPIIEKEIVIAEEHIKKEIEIAEEHIKKEFEIAEEHIKKEIEIPEEHIKTEIEIAVEHIKKEIEIPEEHIKMEFDIAGEHIKMEFEIGEENIKKEIGVRQPSGFGPGRPPANRARPQASPTTPPQQALVPVPPAGSAGSAGGAGVYRVTGCGAAEVAAHLRLLGESLAIIGERLKEHEGQIAVSGSVSVLLDTLLCSLAPLLGVCRALPGVAPPPALLADTLHNIAYIMPGL